MARRTWITLKRGLLEPKHREKLGQAVWLYIYILDRADWEQGAVLDWTDTDAGTDLGMAAATVRTHRHRLEQQGYITTGRKTHGLKLTIHNWTNPREYTGKIHNPKQEKNIVNAMVNATENAVVSEQNYTPTSIQTSNIKHQESKDSELRYVPAGQEFDEPQPKKPTKKQRDSIPAEQFRPMATAIGEVMGWDMKISSNWETLGRKARELILAGYTPEVVHKTYGKGGPWYRLDWRGKKGQPPSQADITKTIGQLSGSVTTVGGKSTAKDRLERRLAKFNQELP